MQLQIYNMFLLYIFVVIIFTINRLMRKNKLCGPL